MSALHVTLVQEASGLDPEENRRLLARCLESVAPETSLVVLPEAIARDFGDPGSDVAGFAEDLDGPFVQEVHRQAKSHDVTIVAGMFERSDDPERPYNTLVVVDGDGLRASYRKIHLYDSFGYRESQRLSAGPLEPVVVPVGDLQVGLMTCYDLRFPELARELVARDAQLLLLPAAWVAGPGKVDHWRTLVRARAIENTVYVAAAGQPGPRYTGHSMVVDPRGEVLDEAGEGPALVSSFVVPDVVDEVRAVNPSVLNRRL